MKFKNKQRSKLSAEPDGHRLRRSSQPCPRHALANCMHACAARRRAMTATLTRCYNACTAVGAQFLCTWVQFEAHGLRLFCSLKFWPRLSLQQCAPVLCARASILASLAQRPDSLLKVARSHAQRVHRRRPGRALPYDAYAVPMMRLFHRIGSFHRKPDQCHNFENVH